MEDDRRLGIALSGGGHRASVFGLGALLAVADAGVNDQVVSISSVSGGSIANGIVATVADFGTVDGPKLRERLAPALRAIAERGILLGGAKATRGYLLALIASAAVLVAAFVAGAVSLVTQWWTAGIVALVVAVLAGGVTWWLVRQRSARTEHAIDRELLGGQKITLDALSRADRKVHHVICTTELQTGTSFYFTNRGVYGWQYGGAAKAPAIPLALAVQASACVPGAFNPRVIDLSELGLTPPPDLVGRPRIVVDDGGVYDNMADEWDYGFANRTGNWPQLSQVQPEPADVLVVVNGSGGWDERQPIGGGGLRQELAGLLRPQQVQYDVSTAHRRRALRALFQEAEDEGRGLDGLFVQITASPYRVLALFGPKPGREPDDRSRRAEEAGAFLERCGYTPEWWDEVVERTSGVATTLAPLGDVTADLLEHGYVLCLVNLYVIQGFGDLSGSFDRIALRRLCGATR